MIHDLEQKVCFYLNQGLRNKSTTVFSMEFAEKVPHLGNESNVFLEGQKSKRLDVQLGNSLRHFLLDICIASKLQIVGMHVG